MNAPEAHPSPDRIFQYAWGYAPPLILEAAVRNGIFDALDSGPKAVAELQRATGASERGLRAVLNALVSLELLNKQGEEYSLTPESATFLVSGKPAYQGGFFKHMSQQLIPNWLKLPEVVETGKPAVAANQEGVGSEFFQQFVADLFPMMYPGAKQAGEALGVARAATPVRVLDLAAGSGVWGIALAQQSPQVEVTAVDWEGVLPITQRFVDAHDLWPRYRFVAGDLLEADFGTGYQIATMGHIIHSEGEERSRKLLSRVFDALAPGGTVVIGEWLPNEERTGPVNATIFAVNMLVNTDEGDTYTFGEISGWLQEIGFENPRLLEAPAPSPLILADRPE